MNNKQILIGTITITLAIVLMLTSIKFTDYFWGGLSILYAFTSGVCFTMLYTSRENNKRQ